MAAIAKLAVATDGEYLFHHYRDRDQNEVNLVIENETSDIVGIEVTAASTVTSGACVSHFRCGLVLRDGGEVHPLGLDMYATPITSLRAERAA